MDKVICDFPFSEHEEPVAFRSGWGRRDFMDEIKRIKPFLMKSARKG